MLSGLNVEGISLIAPIALIGRREAVPRFGVVVAFSSTRQGRGLVASAVDEKSQVSERGVLWVESRFSLSLNIVPSASSD